MKHIKSLAVVVFCAILSLMALTACGEESVSNGSLDQVPSQLIQGDGESGIDSSTEGNPENNGDIIGDETENNLSAGPPPLSMEYDMGISVDGHWFPIWQEAHGLLSALGDDFIETSAPSCVFEGDDKEFAYDGFYVYTNPDGDRDIWYSIYLVSDKLSTSRGIRVGSGVEDVMSAYGERFYWESDSILTYSISGVEEDIGSPCIQFIFEGDTVTAIEIYYPTNVT